MKKIAAMMIVVFGFSGAVFAGASQDQLGGHKDWKIVVAAAPEAVAAPVFAGKKAQPAAESMKCAKEAVAIAKMALDSKAKAYGFSESTLIKGSLMLESMSSSGERIFSIGGDIYKGEYNIVISLDELCSIESVTIMDVSGK